MPASFFLYMTGSQSKLQSENGDGSTNDDGRLGFDLGDSATSQQFSFDPITNHVLFGDYVLSVSKRYTMSPDTSESTATYYNVFESTADSDDSVPLTCSFDP